MFYGVILTQSFIQLLLTPIMFSKQKNEQKRRDLYVGFNSQDTEYR